VLTGLRLRFVERWTSRYHLLDEHGRTAVPGNMQPYQGCHTFSSWEVAKEWDSHRYLLTNKPVLRVEDALRMVHAFLLSFL
jgi:hypothetical protein